MTDIVDRDERSRIMAAIRGKDTKPEVLVRSWLHNRGYRYRLHPKNLPGKPDVFLRKSNAAIFVNGCFWHRHKGCPLAYCPKSNVEFWDHKFMRNVERDVRACEALKGKGVRVLIVWECALRDRAVRDECLRRVENWINSEVHWDEIGLADVKGNDEN